MISIEFLVTSLIVVLLPGTGVIYTVSTGLLFGWRSSIAAAFGCTLGIVPHLVASILGLSALLHTSAIAFQIVKYAGSIYLFYLAWSMWRSSGELSFTSSDTPGKVGRIIMKGFLINILNPKLSFFFLAFLPLFVSTDSSSPMLEMTALSIVFMLLTLVIFIIYGAGATRIRFIIKQSPKFLPRMQKGFAVIFTSLGIKLMAAEQ